MIISLLFYLFLVLNGVAGFQRDSSSLEVSGRSHNLFALSQTVNIPRSSVRKSLLFPSTQQSRWGSLLTRRVSENPSSWTEVLTLKSGTVRASVDSGLEKALWLRSLPATFSRVRGIITEGILQSWWILPMLLALVPIHCAIFKGTCVSMPHWWQVMRMDYIRRSKGAGLVISGFLLSNIAYFISGAFLVNRFPFDNSKKKSWVSAHSTRFTMLGVWMLLAGVISTLFHSVQALGSYPVAESLCYVDHGVAISAAFYFFDTCGIPSRKVWALGIAGLAALVFTYPGYAILHSSWHFLSAAAATQWAIEGHARIQQHS